MELSNLFVHLKSVNVIEISSTSIVSEIGIGIGVDLGTGVGVGFGLGVGIINGKIDYSLEIKTGFKRIKKETYKEALEILRKER